MQFSHNIQTSLLVQYFGVFKKCKFSNLGSAPALTFNPNHNAIIFRVYTKYLCIVTFLPAVSPYVIMENSEDAGES
jgi:hypothetical protein